MDCFNTSRAKFFDYYYYENYPLYCANIASKFTLLYAAKYVDSFYNENFVTEYIEKVLVHESCPPHAWLFSLQLFVRSYWRINTTILFIYIYTSFM